jgi:YlmC/YmxH family sporulation protein
MRLSELQHKDIVNLDGRRIGSIIDVKVNNAGQIEGLIVEGFKNIFKSRKNSGEEIEVSWSKIKKIGQDVILVEM